MFASFHGNWQESPPFPREGLSERPGYPFLLFPPMAGRISPVERSVTVVMYLWDFRMQNAPNRIKEDFVERDDLIEDQQSRLLNHFDQIPTSSQF